MYVYKQSLLSNPQKQIKESRSNTNRRYSHPPSATQSLRERERERMGRSPCCAKEGVNRGSWSAQEDKILKNYIRVHGEGKWRDLPKRAGLF